MLKDLAPQVHADRGAGLTWQEIGKKYGKNSSSIETAYRRWLETQGTDTQSFHREDGVILNGLFNDHREFTDDELLKRARERTSKAKTRISLKKNQYIKMDNDPFMLVWLSDLHIDDPSCDIGAIERDARIIRDMDRVWLMTHGDYMNNFIVGKLQQLQRKQDSYREGLALFEWWIRQVVDKVLVVCAGNHDNWWHTLSGVDILRDRLRGAKVLYDKQQQEFKLVHGSHRDWFTVVRHQFKYKSILNPSHGHERHIERVKLADILVSGHLHAASWCRPFPNVAGGKSYMIQTGTYKLNGSDEYARQLGLAESQDSGSAASIFYDGKMQFFEDLELAADFFRFRQGRK